MNNSEMILKEFIRELSRSRPIPVRKPKNGNLMFEIRQKTGLIQKIYLKESYITGVLGIKKKRLMESVHDFEFQRLVLSEHLLFEGWFEKGMQFLKDKGSKGVEALKDKAMSVPSAIKKFGSDAQGVTAALLAMVKDPSEVSQYVDQITQSIRGGISFIRRYILKVGYWFKERGMEKIATGIESLLKFLKDSMANFYSLTGWKGALSLMALGLCVAYLDTKFGLFEKVKKFYESLETLAENPKKFVVDLIKDAGLSKFEEEDKKDLVAAWAEGDTNQAKELIGQSEFVSAIVSWVSRKMDVLKDLKNKIIEIAAKAAGKALETLAGPIGWLKQLVSLFGTASFVTENLAKMLQNQPVIAVPD